MKRYFIIIFIVVSFLSLRVIVLAKDTVIETGYVKQCFYSTNIHGNELNMLVYLADGSSVILIAESGVIANEIERLDLENLGIEITNAKIITYIRDNNGNLDSIMFSANGPTEYTNQTYSTDTDKFSSPFIHKGLPVIYQISEDSFAKPYLSDTYKYDLLAYRDCIVITKMESLITNATIKEFSVDIVDEVNSKSIKIEVASYLGDVTQGITAKLYSENRQILRTVNSNTYKAEFVDLENEDKEYIIEFYVEGQTDTREATVRTNKKSPITAYISQLLIENMYGDELFLLANMPNGASQNLSVKIGTIVNGLKIVDGSGLETLKNQIDNTKVISYIKDDSGNVININFGNNEAVNYYDQSYSKNLGKFDNSLIPDLTVFYQTNSSEYNKEFSAPYLQENFKYKLVVYSEGIVITEITDMEKSLTITNFSANVYHGYNSKKITIEDIAYKSNEQILEDVTFTAELYDDKNELLATNTGTDYLELLNLPNEDKTYTIQLYAKDLSSAIEVNVNTQKKYISGIAYIKQWDISAGLERQLQLLASLSDSNNEVFSVATNVIIGDEHNTKSIEELGKEITKAKFISYEKNDDDEISHIWYSNNLDGLKYTNQLYNVQNQRFDNTLLADSIPIFCFDETSNNFLDYKLIEECSYDLSVYEEFILITKINAISTVLIKKLTANIDNYFNDKTLIIKDIEYWGDVTENLTLNLYDENRNLLKTVTGDTYSVKVDNLPNENMVYIIEIFVEGQTCKAESIIETKKTMGEIPAWYELSIGNINKQENETIYTFEIRARNADQENQNIITPIVSVYNKNGDMLTVKRFNTDKFNNEYTIIGNFKIPNDIEFYIKVFWLKDFSSFSPLKVIR